MVPAALFIVRILWLYGPQAVGKSVTSWELLNLLSERDPAIGYVDIDQLGMSCSNEREDPKCHLLKGRGLAAVAAEFALSETRARRGHDAGLREAARQELGAPYAGLFDRLLSRTVERGLVSPDLDLETVAQVFPAGRTEIA